MSGRHFPADRNELRGRGWFKHHFSASQEEKGRWAREVRGKARGLVRTQVWTEPRPAREATEKARPGSCSQVLWSTGTANLLPRDTWTEASSLRPGFAGSPQPLPKRAKSR